MKRLRLRAWRRGTREMDLILGPYADALPDDTVAADLDAIERLMDENDQDLYRWITGAEPAPPGFTDLTDRIAQATLARLGRAHAQGA